MVASRASTAGTAWLDRSAAGPAGTCVVAALGTTISALMLRYLATDPSWDHKANDFYREAWPSYRLLWHGHVLEAVREAPAYAGSLVLRAPFALAALALHGGLSWAYAATALPCLAAAIGFCVWLSAQPRRAGGVGWASRLTPLIICLLNPASLVALTGGHPEELLGAVLCAAGIVLAAQGRVSASAVLIGLCAANKSWGLLAVPAAIAVMPAGSRLRGAALVAAVAGAVMVPVTIARDPGLSSGAASAQLGTPTGSLFYSAQLLWWFGPHAWIVRNSRELLGLVALLLAIGWWLVRRGGESPRVPDEQRAGTEVLGTRDLQTGHERVLDALALLALIMLLRSALDPWNNIYYPLPFLMSLMVYESYRGRMPCLTVIYTIAFAAVIPVVVGPISPIARAALYAAIVVPMIMWLTARVLVPGTRRRAGGAGRALGVIGRSTNAGTQA